MQVRAGLRLWPVLEEELSLTAEQGPHCLSEDLRLEMLGVSVHLITVFRRHSRLQGPVTWDCMGGRWVQGHSVPSATPQGQGLFL